MSSDDRGVGLPAGTSASAVYHRLLREAVERFSEALDDAPVPEDPKAFKSGYADAVSGFEAARLASDSRAAIARFLAERSRELLDFESGSGERRPLAALRADAAPPPPVVVTSMQGSGRLVPSVPLQGRAYRGPELATLAEELQGRDLLSEAAARALTWIAREALDSAGELDLGGRRFALLGAGAELAPTPLLLEAGAEVLWIDLRAPGEMAKDSALSGRLHAPETPVDLLAAPASAAAAVAAFAAEGPVDLGLFAYAPGRGREWRLAAAMNAIAHSLGPERVRSLGLFVSPTSPASLAAEDLAAIERRRAARPGWQSALARLGTLGREPFVASGGAHVARTVVDIQGASYQAAQHLEKLVAAEAFATGPGGLRVSANVAPITRTRSLRHPVFLAAFGGAEAFGVHTFAPETTRAVGTLLWLHDLLHPSAPCTRAAEEPGALFTERFHGGLYALPSELRPSLNVAAVLGLARRPGLLAGFLRR